MAKRKAASTGEDDKRLKRPEHNPFAGAGRKHVRSKAILAEILTTNIAESGQDEITVVEKAAQTISQALGDRDSNGNVTPVAMAAARDVLDRAFGQPKRSVEVSTTGVQIIELVTKTEAKMVNSLTKKVLNEAGEE